MTTASDPSASATGHRLSILLVGTQMALGGAQRLLLDQARWFHANGHMVVAAFFYDKQDLAGVWSQGAEFPILTLSQIRSKGNLLRGAAGLFAAMLGLWNLLRSRKFQVLESFTYDSNLLALPLAWLAGVPVRLATHHGIIEGYPRVLERLHAALVNAGIASKLVNVSRKVLEQSASAGIRREHMTVIPNGIPSSEIGSHDRASAREELGIGQDEVLILSVGRLVYQKGHEYLIQAMQRLVPDFPSARAMICGEGPLRNQLEAQIERLGLARSVQLVGNRLDIGRYLRSADIFILPSRWEGLPVALLEAMDAGLPIIATRVEGVEEVIQDKSQGLLVPPEDARAMVEGLRTLLGDPELRRTMGATGRDRVRMAYTADIMCEKYLALMHNLLQPART